MSPVLESGLFRSLINVNVVATQAAGAVLASIRNTDPRKLLKIHSFVLRWSQTGAHTAAIRAELALYRVNGFTAPYSVNAADPGYCSLQSSVAVPTADLQQVTASGVAAGMTGATIAGGASSPFALLPQWMLQAVPTAGPAPVLYDPLIITPDQHILLEENDGILLTNTTLLGAAAGSHVAMMIEWQELPN